MLNEFIDKVTALGAEATLPQNLTDAWLDELYAAAVDYLRVAASEKTVEDEMFNDEPSMLLLTAVAEILQHQQDYDPTEYNPEGAFFEPLSCYALWVVFEYLARKVQMDNEPPSLETIFDRDRVIDFEERHPEITAALNMLVSGEVGDGGTPNRIDC